MRPFEANTPPLYTPGAAINPLMLVVSVVFVAGSMISTDVEAKGMPTTLPLGAKTPPLHLSLPLRPVMAVVLAVFVIGLTMRTEDERKGIA